MSRIFVGLFLLAACSPSPDVKDDLIRSIMNANPEKFDHILSNPDTYEVQILYTQIDRDSLNRPSFRSFSFNLDTNYYFYPASTVKFPLCILALEKINALGIDGLNKHTTIQHDSTFSGHRSVWQDTTSETLLPSVAHYIKKILVVSDNDAYNRLYEFLGQQAINDRLRALGYSTRILHRLERSLTNEQNRITEAIRFMNHTDTLYYQPMQRADSFPVHKSVLRGKGYFRDTTRIDEPFDFTYKNFFHLADQQRMLRTLLFPETVEEKRRFALTDDDYMFLYRYMSQLPDETRYPPYYLDSAYYYDAYCKFLLFGESHEEWPQHVRIFNKVGDAYGYLIDNAYIVDFNNQIEFMLSAVIYVNKDSIFNDGVYEYHEIGFPFMRDLGQAIYQYEVKRDRTYKPDLSKFKFEYNERN